MDESRLSNSIVHAIAKGGQGKSAMTANLASIVARRTGARTIVVDLDPQANLSRNLGFPPGSHDGGKALMMAALSNIDAPGGDPVELVRVRPDIDLWLVPGGPATSRVRTLADSEPSPPEMMARFLRSALAGHSESGTVFFLDTPAAVNSTLTDGALLVGEHVIVPVKEDDNSIDGVGTLISRINEISTVGDLIELIGVVMFAMDTQATSIEADTRAALRDRYGPTLPVLDSFVRHARKASIDAIASGITADEYALLARTATTKTVSVTADDGSKIKQRITFAGNADALEADYINVAIELGLIGREEAG